MSDPTDRKSPPDRERRFGRVLGISSAGLNPYPAIVGYLIRVRIDDDQTGGRLLAEAEGPRGGLGLAGRSGHEGVVQASQSLEKSLAAITSAPGKVVERLAAATPAEDSVEFGLTVRAEAGLAVAKGSGEGHCKVMASWGSGEGYPGMRDIGVFDFLHRSFRSASDTTDPTLGLWL